MWENGIVKKPVTIQEFGKNKCSILASANL